MSVKKLYIVDDNIDILANYLRILGNSFKVLDVEVTAFNDPQRLLDETERSGMPMAIMTDDEMPSMLGRDMAKELRDRGFKGMILMVSGTADDSVLKNGVSVLLQKPVSLKKVFDVLESAITPLALQACI
jgi:FixJ family two-component response regulator